MNNKLSVHSLIILEIIVIVFFIMTMLTLSSVIVKNNKCDIYNTRVINSEEVKK